MTKPLGRDAIHLASHDAKTAFERDGLLDDLKKALAERILNAEPSSWSGERASGGHEVYARSRIERMASAVAVSNGFRRALPM